MSYSSPFSADSLKFYGRLKGRPLPPQRQSAFEDIFPHVQVLLEKGEGMSPFLDPKDLLGKQDVCLEIGFGAGEHLIYQAKTNPSSGFLGAEAFLNGIASLSAKMREALLNNIKIYHGDVRRLLPRLLPHSLSKIFILFPDPWPKTRHHKRRLITPDMIKICHTLLRSEGLLRIVSDDPSYTDWILKHIKNSELFSFPPGSIEDWRKAPPDWTLTRYEAKAYREGRIPLFMDFQKS